MKNLKKILFSRDFGFGILIFSLVILISIFQPSNKVLVEFGEESVDVKSSRFAMNIPYDMVTDLTLVQKPDMGQPLDGHDDMILQTGVWENETWGEYTACVEIATDNCIVLHLSDGQIFVISRRDNEETQRVFEEFKIYLN